MNLHLFELHIPLLRPFASGLGKINQRKMILAGLEKDGLIGWGEAAPFPGVCAETVDQVWEALIKNRVKILSEQIDGLREAMPVTAAVAIEQAMQDLEARQAGIPLWSQLGGTRKSVPTCAAIGLEPTPDQTCHRVWQAAEVGIGQVKIKMVPGHDYDHLREVRQQFPNLQVAADANGSYQPGDHLFLKMDDLEIIYLEQPFPARSLTETAQLCGQINTPVCLDESAHSFDSARQVIEGGYADMVALKPSLLGPASTKELSECAAIAGMMVKIGGLVETAVGRSHALASAMRPEVAASDLVSPRWFLESDVTNSPLLLSTSTLTAPNTPGIGFDPQPQTLPHLTRTLTLSL